MKITKNPDKYDMNVYLKEKVLKECYTCPFCGENRKFGISMDKDGVPKSHGIQDGIYYNIYVSVSLFKKQLMKVNKFSCTTCGAKWESDPYDVGNKPEYKVELLPIIFTGILLLTMYIF